jgi:hypothetical protein
MGKKKIKNIELLSDSGISAKVRQLTLRRTRRVQKVLVPRFHAATNAGLFRQSLQQICFEDSPEVEDGEGPSNSCCSI